MIEEATSSETTKENPVIQSIGLGKIYAGEGDQVTVLDELDFSVFPGQIVSVEGASGAGKSTFLHVIATIDRPTSGVLKLFGQEVTSMSDREKEQFRAQKLGLIFQHHYLLPDFTVIENTMMPLWIQRLPVREARQKARETLELVGLGHRLNHYPSQISGGEMARAGVARALVGGKELILADEPTGNLDRENSDKLADLLWELQNRLNFTLMIVTHDRDLASRVPARFRLSDGKLQPMN